jgi:hypothetical protein
MHVISHQHYCTPELAVLLVWRKPALFSSNEDAPWPPNMPHAILPTFGCDVCLGYSHNIHVFVVEILE